jgi:hypothetical protein
MTQPARYVLSFTIVLLPRSGAPQITETEDVKGLTAAQADDQLTARIALWRDLGLETIREGGSWATATSPDAMYMASIDRMLPGEVA